MFEKNVKVFSNVIFLTSKSSSWVVRIELKPKHINEQSRAIKMKSVRLVLNSVSRQDPDVPSSRVSKAYNISHSAADAPAADPAHSALVNSSITWTHVLRVFGKYRNHMSSPLRHVVSGPDTDSSTPHSLFQLLGMFM